MALVGVRYSGIRSWEKQENGLHNLYDIERQNFTVSDTWQILGTTVDHTISYGSLVLSTMEFFQRECIEVVARADLLSSMAHACRSLAYQATWDAMGGQECMATWCPNLQV